ncbi:5aec3db5-143a-4528-88de-812745b73b48 [Sclerotinia trifoliorum]|uniref:5aec3db5-143a-4528-88de-812745b73b48 n=1 Tax=Sclerotinia trifoliorum TaxID=28548 RepID=A0A8H2VNZ5_9HELO|nr:5aec3db5-143a-4528-88de-812745b73b48 [Sclerotinia trifoliorum]
MPPDCHMSPFIKTMVEKQKEKDRNTVHVRVGKYRNAYTVEKDIFYQHSPYLGEACDRYSEGLEQIGFTSKSLAAHEEIAEWRAEKAKNSKGSDLDNKSDEGPIIDFDESKGNDDLVKNSNSNGNMVLETKSGDLDDRGNVALTNFCFPHMAALLDLYLFADMARVPALKNQCIKKYYEFTKATGYITTSWLSYMWKYTTKTMLMHKFLLDLLTWEMPPSLLETNSKDFPEELRLELLVNMGYVIQIARHGSSALENSNPLRDLSNYYEKID